MKNKILKQTIKTVMGTIKIELDLPEFDNNLDINISLKKDNDGVMKVCPSWTTTPTPTTDPYPYVAPNITGPYCNSNEHVTISGPASGNVTVTMGNSESNPIAESKKASTTAKKKSSGNLMESDLF